MPESTERGALTEAVFYILLSLHGAPLHGYGIMQNIEALSEGRVVLGAGTLYGALNTLLEKGWIQTAGQAERKKEYAITSAGQRMLAAETNRLKELLQNAAAVLGEGDAQ